MNLKQFILLALAALTGLENAEAADCSKYTGVNLMDCCKLPIPKDIQVYETAAATVSKNIREVFMAECKVFENVYNVSKWIKDGGIYLDAVIKNHDENIEEESWRKVLKPIIENCFKKLTPKKEELQKKAEAAPFNIKNCNVQFAAMNTCITLDAFLKCPAESLSPSQKCTDTNAWISECSPNVLFLVELAPKS